jgi:hypothetical protein
VIDTGIQKHGDIWVCPEEDHVLTRFFFVYLAGQNTTGSKANTNYKNFLDEVQNAIDIGGFFKE